MPGGFPFSTELCSPVSIGDITSSLGTTITASGTTHTKGSWVQLTSALAADCSALVVGLFYDHGAGGATNMSVDIGIGGSGSEIALIQDLFIPSSFNNNNHYEITLPIHIPAGTRISARCQSGVASDTVNVLLSTFDASYSPEGFAGVEPLNFDAANTRSLTTVVSGGGLNVKGSWSQVIASAARDYAGLFVVHGTGASGSNSGTIISDVGIGGAGSEVVIIPDRLASMDGTPLKWQTGVVMFPVYTPVPAGTRIAMRMQHQFNSGSNTFPVAYGIF